MPLLGRWKMLDNLRRSLLAVFSLMTLGACWLLPMPSGLVGTLLILAAISIPVFLPTCFSVLPRRTGIRLRNHFAMLAGDLQAAATQVFLSVAFLPDQAWRMGDAVVRTLVRLVATRRHLLEWTTAAQSSGSPRLALLGSYSRMAGGTSLGLVMAVGAVVYAPSSWLLDRCVWEQNELRPLTEQEYAAKHAARTIPRTEL